MTTICCYISMKIETENGMKTGILNSKSFYYKQCKSFAGKSSGKLFVWAEFKMYSNLSG